MDGTCPLSVCLFCFGSARILSRALDIDGSVTAAIASVAAGQRRRGALCNQALFLLVVVVVAVAVAVADEPGGAQDAIAFCFSLCC